MTKKIAVLSFFLLASCATGHVIKESNRSVEDIRAAIYAISGEPRRLSENKREILSAYFSRRKDAHFDPQKSHERLYAKFIILGDRRPYDIQVQVYTEIRQDGTYEEVGVDDALTDQITSELKQELTKRPENRNVIDDFRAF